MGEEINLEDYKVYGDGMAHKGILYNKIDISAVMGQYGGSFSQALGVTLLRADRDNTIKILTTWKKDIIDFIRFIDYDLK